MTHLVAEDIDPVTLTVVSAPGVVALEGDLDVAAVPAVRERLLSLLRPGASRLVIDMSAVRYADASGLAVLVSTRRRAVLLGGTLHLAALQPEVARVLMAAGLSRHFVTYSTIRAAVTGRRAGMRTAPSGPSQAVAPARALPAQAPAGPGADRVELRAAVAAILASADAWRDADPRRRFSPALSALAQADAGASHTDLVRAAGSLLSVLSREPLTYSPAVAVTAGRLRRLFIPGPRLAMG